jgi:hypothetical protein
MSYCRLTIEDPTSNSPYSQVRIWGRASRTCPSVKVNATAPDGSLLIPMDSVVAVEFALVPPGEDPNDPSNDGMWSVKFPASSLAGAPCGLQISISVACTCNHCPTSDTRAIVCKPGEGPAGNGGTPPGSDPNDGNTGGLPGFPWPGFSPCRALGIVFAFSVLLTILNAVLAACYMTLPYAIAVSATLAAAIATGVLWRTTCNPPVCVLFRALCWAFKWGALAGAVLALAVLGLGGLFVAAASGGMAGVLIYRMQQLRCLIPSMLGWPV